MPEIHPMAYVERIFGRSGKVLRRSSIRVAPVYNDPIFGSQNDVPLPGEPRHWVKYYMAECEGVHNGKKEIHFGKGKTEKGAIRSMFYNMRRWPENTAASFSRSEDGLVYFSF